MTGIASVLATVGHALLPLSPTAEHIMAMPAVEPRRWTANRVLRKPVFFERISVVVEVVG